MIGNSLRVNGTGIGRGAASVLAFLLAAAFAGPAEAAGADDCMISGTVTSIHTGEPLPYANIVLAGSGRGAPADRSGRYVIKDVPPGEYEILASYVGFEKIKRKIVLEPGSLITVDFEMREDFLRTSEIVVTATRTRRLLEELPVTTEIITREEIDEKGAESLVDILEHRPGVTTATSSTGENFVYLNGVDSKRILILVDNIPLSGKLNDRIPLNRIDSDIVDRVEIVKGPGSAIYGSRAMGGVINVITRDYSPDPSLGIRTRAGSNGLYSIGSRLSGSGAGLDYLLSVDYLEEGGYSTTEEIEIRDLHSAGADLKLGTSSGAAGTFEVKAGYRSDGIDSESLFMGGFSSNESTVETMSASLFWNRDLGRRADADIAAYYNDTERIYESRMIGSPMPAGSDTTTDVLAGVRSDFSFQAHDMLNVDAGIDYSNNEYRNDRLGEEKTRDKTGLFLQLESSPIEDLTLIAGGRYDWITDLDPYFSPRASAMYGVGGELKLRGSWGRGFRAPSFVELYSDFQIPIPGMPLFIAGNPDLEPEKSEGFSLGVEYMLGELMLAGVNLFQNRFEDMIVDYRADAITFSYLNVEEATFRGIETQARLYLRDDLTMLAAYNYTDIDKEGDIAVSTISPHTGMIGINYALIRSRLRFSLRGQFFSERDILVVAEDSDDLLTSRKEAYGLIDLTATWGMSDFMDLRLGVRNIGDYTEDEYGPYIGRTFFFGFETDFGAGASAR